MDTNSPHKVSKRDAHVAIVGCGYWGKNHVRNFANLGALAAVCDADPDQAKEYADQYSVPVLSFDEVLADSKIDGVVVATPAETHYETAARALRARKHVLVEKPLALDIARAEDLCSLADQEQCTLMVGHLLQYHPAFLSLRALVRRGELGRLQYIYSNRLNLGKIRREENILWSFAPHDISMILALTGEEPARVTAVGARYLHERIADVTTTHLRFSSGTNAHVYVSWLHPFKEQKLVVVGDRSMAVFDDSQDWAQKLVVYPHQIEWRDGVPNPVRAKGEAVTLAEQEPLREECQHFLNCIETGERPRTDGREGVRVLRVLMRAEQSMSEDDTPVSKGSPAVSSGLVHESAYIDEDVQLGEGTRVWHFSHILPRTTIGDYVTIGQNVVVGPDVRIGDRCKIQNNVSLYQGVELEGGVFCGPSCVFTNVVNPRAEVSRKSEFRATLVRRGATIGANATIVCGHELGEYCFIAAGAVVTSDVPAFALMAGVPARRIGWMSHHGERLGDDLTCPATGRKYRLRPDGNLEPVKVS